MSGIYNPPHPGKILADTRVRTFIDFAVNYRSTALKPDKR